MPAEDAAAAAAKTAEAVARQSYGRLVAFLAARTRDVAGAEDALSDAFLAALRSWPTRGIPGNPEAWLLAAARRKRVDAARRRRGAERASDHLLLIADELEQTAMSAREIPDRRLALMFACAHPALAPAIRAPLILQAVLGFDAASIAAAFLVPPATMGQRLTRAKTKIRDAAIAFHVPERDGLRPRLDGVLTAIYAAFATGWSDPAGKASRRAGLAEEAIWLGRLVYGLLPDEPEAIGLLALMLYAEARRTARRDANDAFVPLSAQDPAVWDAGLNAEADALLPRAAALGVIGRFQLEAAVQSVHAARRRTGETDWAAIASLYDALLAITGSPVVALNRAIAIAETEGAAAGLACLDALGEDPRMVGYQPFWAARADLLARAGAAGPARDAYERAIALESDPAVRGFLARRQAEIIT